MSCPQKEFIMTRSIFDPNSGETERSGSRFTPPDANQISQMPPDVVDGEVEPEEAAEHGEQQGEEDATAAEDQDVEPQEDETASDAASREAKRSPEE
jgi:hypothetical protein